MQHKPARPIEAVTNGMPAASPLARPAPPSVSAAPADFCENCGETRQLAKIKGCIRCLRCGFKADCSGM